ncbi:hypothetical protein V2J09_016746 [Rumex salicifolius]
MAISRITFASLTLLTIFLLHSTHATAATKPYIVYMGEHSHGDNPTEEDSAGATDFHHQFLASFLGSHDMAKDAIFYSYNRHINGFAANLEEDQAAEIAKHPDVVSVFLSGVRQLHTTHSWEFMMMERHGVVHRSSIWPQANYGEDVIIAHLDTGVWPESKRFSDKNYGPIPSRWKGNCNDSKIHCNRKLIGAKYHVEGALSFGLNLSSAQLTARDEEGHGSHTLSTAGGNPVPAKLIGLPLGTAKGGSPRARVATYKVCWGGAGCFDADIMAGLDQAIYDGVDILSISLGGANTDYASDPIAIGAYHAAKKGIVVVASAGNSGPEASSVSNVAPWIITVAASTIDRDFANFVELRDGQRFKGKSLSSGLQKDGFYPLITGAQAKAANATRNQSLYCHMGSLDEKKVKGKIVVCLRGVIARVEKSLGLSRTGAAGMILYNAEENGDELEPDLHFVPSAHITYKDGLRLLAYMNSTSDPLGYITTPEAELNQKNSPSVADFSSRGPSTVVPEILKPDITAPGVNIIAAWSETASATDLWLINDTRVSDFNMISGTSMSCPHVAGVAGLLKSLHRHWSPAAIKSAIMTTARTRDNRMSRMLDQYDSKKATPFMYGSGHVRPNSAMNPGLVYDLTPNDYLDFLCAIGYNDTSLLPFTKKSHYECDHTKTVYDFNYPSVSLPHLTIGKPFTVTRRVKNVGPASSYSAEIHMPSGVRMSVHPTVLVFEHTGQELTYKLTVTAETRTSGYAFGGLTWSDGKHYVRSPVAIQTRAKK